MPNYCACSLTIEGAEADLAAFYETLARPDETGCPTPFAFHQTVPSANTKEPVRLPVGGLSLGMIGAVGLPPNVENWGTKWDAIEPHVLHHEATRFVVQFDTAWSPPLRWAAKVAALFPRLTFRLAYCEKGVGFYGVWSCNHARQETRTEENKFTDGDTVGFRLLEDGTKELLSDRNDAHLHGYLPAGRVKAFMEQHMLSHMGG